MIELVAAGVEGGSKRRIEEDWGLADVADLREHWRVAGPPPHIALAVIAASLGNRITEERGAPDLAKAKLTGPTIAEMAAMAQPHGSDTMGATMRILERLQGGLPS